MRGYRRRVIFRCKEGRFTHGNLPRVLFGKSYHARWDEFEYKCVWQTVGYDTKLPPTKSKFSLWGRLSRFWTTLTMLIFIRRADKRPNAQQFSPAILNLRGIEGGAGGTLFVIFTICSVPLQIPLIYRIHPVFCFSLHFANLQAGARNNGALTARSSCSRRTGPNMEFMPTRRD